jgi:uncharacterized membrane protein YgdD (TMEM256/DUF423 family)
MDRLFFILGSIFAGVAVGTGAFGAHGLQKMVGPEQLVTWGKAAQYQMYHALALFVVAWALTHWQKQTKLLTISGWFFVAGSVFFSGSLYLMVLTDINLGYITPLGGVAYVIGWLGLAVAAWRDKR